MSDSQGSSAREGRPAIPTPTPSAASMPMPCGSAPSCGRPGPRASSSTIGVSATGWRTERGSNEPETGYLASASAILSAASTGISCS